MARTQSPAARPQEPKQPERSSKVPVFTCRHRALKTAVWKNDTENGPMFNTTVTRRYKDREQWRMFGSFGYDDVLIVAELLRTCHGLVSREIAKGGHDAGVCF